VAGWHVLAVDRPDRHSLWRVSVLVAAHEIFPALTRSQAPSTIGAVPLSNIKVLDLTRARSGPTCVRQLSEMGASVIRIEDPEGGDIGERHHFDFQNLQVNKRSLTLNLKSERGRAVFLKLVEQADVVVENYRPDVKHRLGIDYETLSAINPRLVYASISGFGQTGRDQNRPGFDQIAQGMSGVMTVNGESGQGPLLVGLPVADLTAGFMLAYGVVCALYERERSGRGQWVHTSLLQAMIRLMDHQAARWLITGDVARQNGNNHPLFGASGVYKARDAEFMIQAAGENMFNRLCESVGAPELLADERFKTRASRYEHRDEFHREIEGKLAARDAAEWIDILTRAGVPAGPICNVKQCFEDEQVQSLPLRADVDSPGLGRITVLGHGVNLERTPPRMRCGTPEPGQHTDEILAEAGYSAADIDQLRQAGAI
jgi:crotonobetainyl-CoA:carnitine CoA-transferase CaiB-like acyl-CoA transferase